MSAPSQFRVIVRQPWESRGRAYLGRYGRDLTQGRRLMLARDFRGRDPERLDPPPTWLRVEAEKVASWIRGELPAATVRVAK